MTRTRSGMKFELMDSVNQFEELKKGDCIIVKWTENWVKHMPNSKQVMTYNIYENKKRGSYTEIICQLKGNHYFNYVRYLEGLSSAIEVYKVIDNPKGSETNDQ